MEIYDVKNKSRETQIPSLVFVGNLMVFIFFAFLYQFKSCFSKVFLVTENQELLSHVHLDLSPPTKKKKKTTALMHNHYIANTFKGQTDLSAFYIVNPITF